MPAALIAPYRSASMPTSSSTLATVPAGKTWSITNVLVTNPTTGIVTVTLNLDGAAILPGVEISPKGFAALDIRQVLTAGKQITGVASAAGVHCHVSGAEVS